jgi:hypothetical protein
MGGWYRAGNQDGVLAMGGVEVAAVEEADCVGRDEATEEFDEADFIVDFEIGSRHCGVEWNLLELESNSGFGQRVERTRSHVSGTKTQG